MLEIFWPKKMRRLVGKYKENGTLNHKAVEKFNRYISGHLTFMFYLAVILFAVSPNKLWVLIIFIVPIFAKIDGYSHFKRHFLPYEGKKVKGKITGVEWRLYGGGQVIHYQPEGGAYEASALGGSVSLKKEDTPEVGEEMAFYEFHQGTSRGAMPDIHYLNEIYSLSTSNI